MQRLVTSRYLARLVIISVLACSVLAASSPCSWMIASSAHNCCKKSTRVSVNQRCHEQTISSCCAKGPQNVAVTSSVAWSMAGLAPQGPIHQWRCLSSVSRTAALDFRPSTYLQDPILRI
jgi:hypothetical protein